MTDITRAHVRDSKFLTRSPHAIFHPEWYSHRYIGKRVSPQEAFLSYLNTGWRVGNSPHPLFSAEYYLSQDDNARRSGVEPLHDYVTRGWKEGLDPHPLFEGAFYRAQVENFAAQGSDPLSHYLRIGWRNNLKPNRFFDPAWYLDRYPDIKEARREPLTHYLETGWTEGRRPNEEFDPDEYRRENPASSNPIAFVDFMTHHRRIDATPTVGGVDLWHHESNVTLGPQDVVKIDSPIGIFIHIYYDSITDEIVHYLLRIEFPTRIYISTDTAEKARHIELCFLRYGFEKSHVEIRVLPNRGYDLGAFVVGYGDRIREHDICLKIHAKKSAHNSADFGRAWRRHLYDELLFSPERVRVIVNAFLLDPELGMAIPRHWKDLDGWIGIGDNYQAMRRLLHRIGEPLRDNQKIEYPSGSMFWFRGTALSSLLDLNLTYDEFEENIQRDGTVAHALERCFLFFVVRSGATWALLPPLNSDLRMTRSEQMLAITEAGVFDSEYYLRINSDVKSDALEHYFDWGWKEGRNPSAAFNTRYYERVMRAEGPSELDPLTHFAVSGRQRGLPTAPPARTSVQVPVGDLYASYRRADTAPEYVGETFPVLRKSDVKILAFYFPQFHPFAENDRFWGRGFTEWTNTTKANPMFKGHYQPRLPGELGFYDTRLKPVLSRQIELAKQYGIYGFCFHHYFFSGKPVMRAPYDHILSSSDLDIPFCLHWANEPWTVRWDGLASQKGVLLAQRHDPEDDLNFFRDIEPALRDRRYITIDGRPLVVIYRPALFPDMAATIERWRACCRRIGLPDLYLAVMHTGFEGPVDPRRYGFDAAIEYPPHHLGIAPVSGRVLTYDKAFEGNIYDYEEAAEKALAREKPEYRMFRGIMPEWDCTPRRQNPDLFINCTPHGYQRWLEGLYKDTEENNPKGEQLIFINAWNEWAEGAYLEPDRKYGYAYLSATAAAINNYKSSTRKVSSPRILIGAHIFYTDLIEEFIVQFENIRMPFDLFVTTTIEKQNDVERLLNERLGRAAGRITVMAVKNFGRDFAPFLLQYLPQAQGYELCCWCHSKKSPYEASYGTWRGYLLRNLFGSPDRIAAIVEAFESDPKLGVVYPKAFPAVASKVEWGSNFNLAHELLGRLGVEVHEDEPPHFPTAAMFWFRPAALKPLLDLKLGREAFEAHADGPRDPTTNVIVDGTISHALERMILYVADAAGYKHREYLFEN